MLHCGSCGGYLRCEKNGSKIFSGDLKMVRNTDTYKCYECNHMVNYGHGGWREAPIHEINLSEKGNVSLNYEHYSAVEKRPVCVRCSKTMDFMGDGILLLEDEHAELPGKMWVCPHCDYIFIDSPHTGWPPPRSLDEKRELEERYAPNIVRIGTGVIPFFDSIKKAEKEEGLKYNQVVNSA